MNERDLIERQALSLYQIQAGIADSPPHALMAEVRAYLAQAPAKPVAWRDPAYELAAKLSRMDVIEVNGEDFLRRETVMDFVIEWRSARNKMPKAYATPPDAAAEIAAMRAANLDCMDHFNALKVDYDNQAAEIARLRQTEAALSANLADDGREIEALEAEIAALRGAQPAVPEGWRLVPKLTTPKMRAACRLSRAAMVGSQELWDSMLSAAPTPPKEK